MFENFKTIIINGGCFASETELKLFDKDALSFIYGRNGSGKSTIANCIGELVKTDEEKNTDFSVKAISSITDEMKDSVFIFNEEFVRDQVRVENDGINTIVMLGEQVELDDTIAQKQKVLNRLEEEYLRLDEERKKYENPKENISPLYFYNIIREALRDEGGWADVDRDIKGNTVKSRISEDLIKTLLNLEEPMETCEVLQNRVRNNLNLYRESEDAQEIKWIKEPVSLPDELDPLSEILVKNLDTPLLTEREHRLLETLTKHTHHDIEVTKQMLAENWEFCPLCLREITGTAKNNIENTLTHILNEQAKQYETLLNEELKKFDVIETSLPFFSGSLNEKELKIAENAKEKLNSFIIKIQQKIKQRKQDIYTSLKNPFTIEESLAYKDALRSWSDAMNDIELCVKRFNESVNKRNKLIKKLHEDNNLLARKKHSVLLMNYKNCNEKKAGNQACLESKRKEQEEIQLEIKTLKAQKERTDIALSYINQELQYVFYSKNKVKLEPGNGCYKLRINGKAVKPKKISVGERNVLGLCYFFAKLFGGKTETTRYSSEYLIIIDDPVSSFDHGNRIGVMSLLRFQIRNILKGNVNSRILVLSHDLQSIFDLIKIRNDITGKNDPTFAELVDQTLKVHKYKNEYKKLLEYVFEFAAQVKDDESDDIRDLGIGNTMRRLLEAFSSFCYNMSFENMLRKEDILIEIPEGKRNYYANFMYRLILNTESHMEENIYTLNGITARFSKDEKIQTAKSVLLFLNYVNKAHINSYLPEKMSVIESWKKDEEEWILQ